MGEPDKPNATKVADAPGVGSPEAQAALRNLYDAASESVVQVETNTGQAGSGFIADSEGRIVTDAHVIEGAKEIIVLAKDGTIYKAGLEKLDDTGDLAVLKLLSGTSPGPPVQFSNGDLESGQRMYGVGHGLGARIADISLGQFQKKTTPLEFYNSFQPAAGEILARRNAELPPDQRVDADAALAKLALRVEMRQEHGDSGGPVFDQYGKVAGVMQIGIGGFGAMTPSERVEALLREPGKFNINHGFRAEKWAEGMKLAMADQPIATASAIGLAGGVVAFGTPSVGRAFPKLMGGGFVVLGGGSLFHDVPRYYNATDSRDSLKYGMATGGDLLTAAGGIAMFIPKVRTIGMIAGTLGLGTKLAADFVPNRLMITDISRQDGDARPPFSWQNMTKKR